MEEKTLPNPSITLKKALESHNSRSGWVTKDTAILIVHGIGDQVPLATLDDFSRGLVKAYRDQLGDAIRLRHELMPKTSAEGIWFDNVLRIQNHLSEHVIDVYEYYWANYTEDKSSWSDLDQWVQGVVKGAKNFYHQEENAELGNIYKDQSIFFDKKGKFNAFAYRFFIGMVGRLLMMVSIAVTGAIKFLSYVPLVGNLASSLAGSFSKTFMNKLTNVIGDVAIYNVVDPKSKFYRVRKEISEGAISALRYLIEKPKDSKLLKRIESEFGQGRLTERQYDEALRETDFYYGSVIVAGHSLGSQVAYDAINKLNLLLNEGQIKNYVATDDRKDAISQLGRAESISNRLNGFITFGCPLDKIMFFLREQIPIEQFIKQQMVNHYHGFKQRPFGQYSERINKGNYVKAECGLERMLENIKWRNYYDHRDYVSGGLDYYLGVTNVDCQFKSNTFSFTHSDYWTFLDFYKDLIFEYLD